MNGSGSRTTLGIGVAVLIAAIGPALVAVGEHTGNHSGSEPLVQEVSVPIERTAAATWGEPDGVERLSITLLEQTEQRVVAGTIAQDAHRATSGTVVARREFCDGDDCVLDAEWTAELGSPITEGAHLSADPALAVARFRGWLREDGDGPACLFDVRWTADLASLEPDVSATHVATPEQTSTAVFTSLRRSATASVIADCWEANGSGPFASGAGELTQQIDLEHRAGGEGLSLEHLLD